MKKLTKFLENIRFNNNIRLIIYFISIILVWGLFENYIIDFIINELIPLFDRVNFSLLVEIIIAIFFITIILIRSVKIITQYCENKFNSYSFLAIGGIYFYYRYIADTFEFFRFSFFSELAYLDMITVQLVSSLVLLIINYYLTFKRKQNNFSQRQSSFQDKPWKPGELDLLNRYEAAKNLARTIVNIKTEDSFSYGIVGGWGDGKTSFLNMIESELVAYKNIIIVKFNPWKSSSSENIQKDFLINLNENLSVYSSEISPKLNKYKNALLGVNNNLFLKVISNIIQEHYEISRQFYIINEAISKINKKIVVFIDDLDRLDKEEVFQVLKLIRNTCSFTNTVFIAAYDRNYINDALKKFSEYRYDVFVEKIFQQEIVLPEYPFNILAKELNNRLKEQFVKDQKILPEIESKLELTDEEEKLLPSGILSGQRHIEKVITNLRDVKRFVNSFFHSYLPLKDEVNLIDMFNLELLKLKYYNLYIKLKDKEFLTLNDNNFSYYKFDSESFKKYCDREKLYDHETPQSIIESLFPKKNSQEDKSIIAYNKSFPIYFYNRLFNRLSRKEFNQAISNKSSKLKTVVQGWLSNGYFSDIDEYLTSIKYENLNNKKEFENFIEIHFILLENDIDINVQFLLSHFEDNNRKEIGKKFYDYEENYNQYITNKLKNADFPYKIRKIIYKLIGNYLYNYNYPFLFSLEELQQIAIDYLNSYLNRVTDLSHDGMWLYYTCIEKIDENHRVYLLDEASALMKNFITKKNSKFYLDNFIRPVYTQDDGHSRTVEPFVSSIFGSYNEFEKFIANNKSYHGIDTIRYFFDKFKKNNYQPVYIEDPDRELNIKSA